MPRVKAGNVTRKRHKKILKLAKGYVGSKHALFRVANEQVLHSLSYAYRDRRNRKRDFRRLWITRINAATRLHEFDYHRFINGLLKANIKLNRQMLSILAIEAPNVFKSLVMISKQHQSQSIATAINTN